MIVPGVYQHYKGGRYLVLFTVRHHETRAEYVVYVPLEPHRSGDGIQHCMRPLHGSALDPDGWLTSVTDGDGKERPRFRLLYPLRSDPQ